MPGIVRTRVTRQPKGLVGVIAPWNYPLFLAVGDVIPALLAGNAVLSKADSQAPLSLLAARALAREAGLPDDVWQVVAGRGSVHRAGAPRRGRPPGLHRVDRHRPRARRGVRSPADRGVAGARRQEPDDRARRRRPGRRGPRRGAGLLRQRRPDLHRDRADLRPRARARRVPDAGFAEATRALTLGAAYDYSAEIGSLTTADQLEAVEAHVADALDHGAELVAGGKARPDLGPLFFEPTVLTGVLPTMQVCAEETFGPVVAVYPVADDEEAVTRANDTEYGLSASIWSADLDAARRLAGRIRAGAVNINDGYLSAIGSVAAPMGGMRASGVGRRHGADGILRYTETQTVAAQRRATPYPAKPGAVPGRRRGGHEGPDRGRAPAQPTQQKEQLMTGTLNGRVVALTGGARGIGAATAQALAAEAPRW